MNRTYRNKSLRKGGGGRFARLEDVFREKGIDNPSALLIQNTAAPGNQ